jgi:IrrE N-terminal-like domain
VTAEEFEQLAAELWQSCGGPPEPPRDLQPFVPLILPVFVVSLSALSAVRVFEWLTDRGLPVPDRDPPANPLLGCLVAHRGQGAIFLEESLKPPDRRFILAHEFAHFVLDYQAPRTRAIRRLGPSILPVLDGLQPSDDAIEFAAALATVPLGVHSHFLDFDADCENRASQFALELLAPRALTQDVPLEELEDRWGIPKRWAKARWPQAVRQPFDLGPTSQ